MVHSRLSAPLPLLGSRALLRADYLINGKRFSLDGATQTGVFFVPLVQRAQCASLGGD
jgi:hypothetical protein